MRGETNITSVLMGGVRDKLLPKNQTFTPSAGISLANNCYIKQYGNMVVANLRLTGVTASVGTWVTVGTIPNIIIPKQEVIGSACDGDGKYIRTGVSYNSNNLVIKSDHALSNAVLDIMAVWVI